MTSRVVWVLGLLSLGWQSCQPFEASTHNNWLAYYQDEAAPEAFSDYGLLVFDSQYHPPIPALAAAGKTILGYISLGEVEGYRAHFGMVRAEGILFDENPNWPGSYFVDLRSALWRDRVLGHLIPKILNRGFHGLFLDTLDNAAYLESTDPVKYRGMRQSAAKLVMEIRSHFPSILIMMNRAYEILPEVAGHIDMELAESCFSDFDFSSKQYRRVPQQEYQQQVQELQRIRALHPGLEIFTLDYWDPSDDQGIRTIYREQESNGFNPYVATVELDRIVPRPR